MFRLGTTSYIVPDDLAANARYLAGRVQDMQLVLFDLDDGPSNFPDPPAVRELAQIGRATGLTYTVHLPLDIRLGPDGEDEHISLVKARTVIDLTHALEPWAYVLHLDGRDLLPPPPAEERPGRREEKWLAHALRALELLAGWAGGFEKLAIENLEGYPPDFVGPVLERAPVSRCVDVGHLWLDGHDPAPHLRAALPRARVVHLHGLAATAPGEPRRDHQSLAHTPPEQLDPVLALLARERYAGVLTLEVFGEADFHSSLTALQQSLIQVNQPPRREVRSESAQ